MHLKGVTEFRHTPRGKAKALREDGVIISLKSPYNHLVIFEHSQIMNLEVGKKQLGIIWTVYKGKGQTCNNTPHHWV